MDDKQPRKKRKLPSRNTAIALQYIGMLILFGTWLLQMFFLFDKATLIYYYLISAATLGYGVLLRRIHDKE